MTNQFEEGVQADPKRARVLAILREYDVDRQRVGFLATEILGLLAEEAGKREALEIAARNIAELDPSPCPAQFCRLRDELRQVLERPDP